MGDDKLTDDLNKSFEDTGNDCRATSVTDITSTDGNKKGSSNLISIELSEDLKKLGIITNFNFDKKSKLLILSLNHEHKGRTIISPVFQDDWLKTAQKFKGQMTSKGMTKDHADMICDIVDNNYQKILDISADANEADNEQQERKPIIYIRKYTGNGTLPLHESVVIAGQSSFLHLIEDYKPKCVPAIESIKRVFHPLDTTDTQNPLPYIFGSAEVLQKYLDLASKETFEMLLHKVEAVYKKYVNAAGHYILILAADTIYSYFQDKFWNWFEDLVRNQFSLKVL